MQRDIEFGLNHTAQLLTQLTEVTLEVLALRSAMPSLSIDFRGLLHPLFPRKH